MRKVAIIVLLLALVCTVSASDLWEYKVETLVVSSYSHYSSIASNTQEMLNKYGADGWELVTITQFSNTQYPNVFYLTFKRQLSRQ